MTAASPLAIDEPRSERILRAPRPAYPRLKASILCRPAGLRPFAPAEDGAAPDPRGVRIYSDEPFEVGERWKLEILHRTQAPRTFIAEVTWIEPLADNPDARYDVGLTIETIEPSTSALIAELLDGDDSPRITPT